MAGEVAWCGDPAAAAAGGAVALIASLDDPAITPHLSLAPTELDLNDHGRRRGIEAVRFLARRALLRRMIGCRLGVDPSAVVVGYDENGRPLLRAPDVPLYCSVSARLNQVALAIAPVPVGIDLEPVELGPIPWSVLSPGERVALDALAPAALTEAFLAIWTVKEAYVKALGTGFVSEPSNLDVAVGADGPVLRDGNAVVPGLRVSTRRAIVDGRPVRVACVLLPPR